MILGFKTQINGKPTYFPEKILAGVDPHFYKNVDPKIHSIRKGYRWSWGKRIHMATGVGNANYYQFNKDIPQLSICLSTQSILIIKWSHSWDFDFVLKYKKEYFTIQIDGLPITLKTAKLLAKNDGFDSLDDFLLFFNEPFQGQIIHWSYFRY